MLQILCWTLSFRVWAFSFGCFPDWSFFFLRRLSLRGMFRLFYAASKGVVRNRSKFFRKPERLEYYPKGGDFLWNASLNLSQWRQHLPLQHKKAKLRSDRRQKIKGDNQKRKQPAIHSWKLYRSARYILWIDNTGRTCMGAKKTDRKHCFLPIKRENSVWLSLVMPVPCTVSITKRTTRNFRAPPLLRATSHHIRAFFNRETPFRKLYSIERQRTNPIPVIKSQEWNSLLPEPRRRPFAIAAARPHSEIWQNIYSPVVSCP